MIRNCRVALDMDSNEVDFNDAIERIVLSEDLKRKSAYDEAFEVGHKQGFEEAFPHGLLRGGRIAREVGFLRGFALFWNAVLTNEKLVTKLMSPIPNESKLLRQITSVSKLRQMAEDFPKQNVEEDLDRKLLELTSRFKQTCSLLNIDPNTCWTSSQNREVF